MNLLFEQYLKDAQSKGSLNYAKDRPLSAVSTFGIGGNAAFFVVPRNIASAKEVVRELYLLKERYVVIGNASDLLFADNGFDGAVICTRRINGLHTENGLLYAECGVHLPSLCRYAAENCFSGFEGLCSIPATVGGAIKMNAGAFGCEIADTLSHITVYSPKTDSTVIKSAEDCGFAYRKSSAAGENEIILSAVFSPKTGKSADITSKMERDRRIRSERQPIGTKSAGSYFKRPKTEKNSAFYGKSAGEIIDICGLKGKSVGGAYVSEKHGNFIINKNGSARASDVLALAEIIKSEVFEKTGVILEEEVLYIG